jgi:hypothetical protein
VDPAANTVQASYVVSTNGVTSTRKNIGAPTSIPAGWFGGTTGFAVGIISTSTGPGPEFPATWGFIEVTPGADTTPPSVHSVAPLAGATGVPRATNVSATFSEAMNASTINANTFTLRKQGSTTAIAATVSYDGATKKATLNPAVDLKKATTYTATIRGGANGVKDTAGNAPANDKVWSFTTG